MAKISGNISADARLIIVKESDWTVESNTTETGGAFEIDGLTSGAKTVISRAASGECTGYGSVTAVEPVAPDPVLHTAMIFSNRDNDGYITAWNSTWNGARTASTGGEVGVGGYNSDVAAQASKTGMGGAYEYMVTRSFTEFNLSALSSSDRTFQSAVLQVGGFGYNDTNISLFEGTQQSPPIASDFDSFVNSDDPLANIVTWDLWESDSSVKSNIFTLNAGGNNYVSSKMGNTAKFCFREWSSDRDGPAPTGNKRNGMHYSWQDPQQNYTTHEYFHVGPLLKVSYMKIPVWTSIFNNTKWQPYGNNANNGVWNGSAWVSGAWGSIDLQIKTGETWAVGYKPNKIKITFTGPSSLDLYLYSNKTRALIGNNTGMTITSGQEIVIPWNYVDANIIELYLDGSAITITNIEFLER